jgi:glycosyltransferase involved in cell wall biosynthesis
LQYTDDVVVVDDASDYSFIEKIMPGLEKASFMKHSKNKGPYLNKISAVEFATHDHVILLDADNILNQNYYQVVAKTNLEDDTMYLPVSMGWSWDFKEYEGKTFDYENIKPVINDLKMQIALNTGNYVVPAHNYATVARNHPDPKYTEVFYLAYHWLRCGFKIHFLKDLEYQHSYNVDGRYCKASKEHDDKNKEIVSWFNQ